MTVGFRIRRKTDHQWWQNVDRRRPLNTDSPLLAGAHSIHLPLPWLSGAQMMWDLTGRFSTVAPQGNITWGRSQHGPTMGFNGSSSVLSTNSQIFNAASDSITVVAAVTRTLATTTEFPICGRDLNASNKRWRCYVQATTPRCSWLEFDSGGTGYTWQSSTADAQSGVRYMYGVVRNGDAASRSVQLFADGKQLSLFASPAMPATHGQGSPGGMTIGRIRGTTTANGSIEYVLVFARALMSSEMWSLWEQDQQGWISGPHAILRTQSTRRYSFGATSGGAPASTLFRRGLSRRVGSRGAA